MFDIHFLFKQICNAERHEPSDCSLIDMTVVSGNCIGLFSTFCTKMSTLWYNAKIVN